MGKGSSHLLLANLISPYSEVCKKKKKKKEKNVGKKSANKAVIYTFITFSSVISLHP